MHVRVAPDTDEPVHAVLVHDLGDGLRERLRPQLHGVEHRDVLEALRAVHAKAPASEDVIQQERCLAQSAGGLEALKVQVFETAESAALQVAPAIDYTEIELAFLAPRVVTVLALGLHGARTVAAERREERGASVEIEIAGASGAYRGSDIYAHNRKLLVPPLRFVHRACGFGVRDILRLRRGQRFRQTVHLVFQGILLVAQVTHFAAQLIVFPLQVLQLGQNIVQLVELLKNLIAAFLLFLQQVVQFVCDCRNDIADAAFLNHPAGAVGEGHDDPAVHEATFFSLVVHFGGTLAVARCRDLVVRNSVLHQERLDGVGPLQRELFVIWRRTNIIRVAGNSYAVIAMLAHQVRQP